MGAIVLINFVELMDNEKLMVLNWRNNEKVRYWMCNPDTISKEDHFEFIIQLKNDKTKQYHLAFSEDHPTGVIYFTDMTQNSAEIGIYANPQLRGIGEILMKALVEYAFVTLHLTTLIATVFADNERAKHLYEKFDFTEINRSLYNGREMITMELNQ
jgi:UDP-4-amino-4,6-dideoxy-N-acetyl-beta-L-altrosamine N-acetyltransferase